MVDWGVAESCVTAEARRHLADAREPARITLTAARARRLSTSEVSTMETKVTCLATRPRKRMRGMRAETRGRTRY